MEAESSVWGPGGGLVAFVSAFSTGFFGGAHLGYNWQYGHYLFGVETDIDVGNTNAHGTGSLGYAQVDAQHAHKVVAVTDNLVPFPAVPVHVQTLHSEGAEPGREYDIAAAMLMPGDEVASLDLETLDDITAAAERFKVTPSAMTIRAMRLRLVEPDAAGEYLAELRRAFASRAKSGGRTPYIQNAMRKYVGREMSRRMFDVLDAGRISPGEFSRVVCVKKIAPGDFDAFREAVR